MHHPPGTYLVKLNHENKPALYDTALEPLTHHVFESHGIASFVFVVHESAQAEAVVFHGHTPVTWSGGSTPPGNHSYMDPERTSVTLLVSPAPETEASVHFLLHFNIGPLEEIFVLWFEDGSRRCDPTIIEKPPGG